MKIALVSPYDFAYPGGVTEHVAHLAEQFRTSGHEVHIVAPSSDDESEPITAIDDGHIHRIGRVVSIPANGSVARITLSLRSYLQAKRLLQQEQFDLIHLHEPMMPALPLTVLRHSNAANVGTFHAYRNSRLAYFYGKGILRPFFRKLHGHIAVSRAAREFVGEYFPADYRIIGNGIDFPRFNTPTDPLESPRDRRPTVLFVGRLEKRKGLRFLLRAWPMVVQRVPDARLIVVGRGRPLEGYKRFATRQGWSPSDVTFAGYVSSEDLPRYYQAADLFCAPNTGQESFGIVLLEAMAAGAPIVASDIPGYRDVVAQGEHGLLVEPKNPGAIADAICRLLSNPELRASMRRAGQAKARFYDWPRIASQVLDYYEHVLERRAGEPEPQHVRFARVRRMAGMLMRV
ncbi:MAG: glycosyltransferase family 4 protein [Chloroflexi bacterium]|nr:glycosyltransferase family 4 protein [Chloroflexota bacterium]MBV9543620.1 glycosyltransferase family 4 protein [Chloroflexota bacterium]